MKFNKLYILPLLALGLFSCSNEDDSLFDQSAAERLEAGQKNYFNALCADGGIWAMEYFANPEESGYLFVMKFNADKSVDIHTDHKWIGSTYKSERSLWDVINDDGNVLTFNSFNTLFHVFSTPENIVGTDAPVDSNGEDVDEQGYGHNGDYEFMLMENNNGNIRLLGKKRGYYAYLRHLPADTDPEAYLAKIAAKRALFANKKFPTYVMTETASGAEYDVTGLGSGVVSVMPTASTNPYAQTETKACILTAAGLRPISAFDCIRRNDSRFSITEFTWAADGSLTAPGYRIAAPDPATNLSRTGLKWSLAEDSFSPALVAALEKANDQTVNISKNNSLLISAFGRNPKLNGFSFGFYTNPLDGKSYFAAETNCGILPFYYYGNITRTAPGKFTIELTMTDEAMNVYILPVAPEVKNFLNLLSGEFTAENPNVMDASLMKVTSVTNPEISFTAKVK